MSQPDPAEGTDLARQALAAARARARQQGATTTAKQRHRPKSHDSGLDRREPTNLQRVLLQVQADYGWQTGRRGGKVLVNWASIVGPSVAEHLSAAAYDTEARLLEILPDSGAWLTLASLIKASLIDKVNRAIGPDSVRHISILGVGTQTYRTPVSNPDSAAPQQQTPAAHPRPRIRVRADAPPGFHRALQAHQQVWDAHKASPLPSTNRPAIRRSHIERDISR
ncbi:DUF721 domain-containing protein [Streptomyces sp. NPDC001581]|uniref:DUF721 domain-containing protein n=1 Tax=Streptomyces sp. NPDC001581 TaxID=3154386 RepID=UPI00332CCA77